MSVWLHGESIGPYGTSWGSNGLHGVSWGRLTGIEWCGRHCSLILWLKVYPGDQPCGSSAYPLDQRNLSHRVDGGGLILQQPLSLCRNEPTHASPPARP